MLSSTFGFLFRGIFSLVDGHFFTDELNVFELFGVVFPVAIADVVTVVAVIVVVVVAADTAVPNNRKGENVVGRQSDSSVSDGLPIFELTNPGLLIGGDRLLLLSFDSLRTGNNLNDEKLFSNGRTS